MSTCPDCKTEVAPDERFCEGCGAELTEQSAAATEPGGTVLTGESVAAVEDGEAEPSESVGRPCRACEGGVVQDDGYCDTCGEKAASERDHWAEQPASWVAGVCDRGRRHERNEDALAVAADAQPGGVAVLVVCDGVSSAPQSDVASLAAARAARDVLCSPRDGSEVVAAGPDVSTGSAEPSEPSAAADPDDTHDDSALRWGLAIERAAAAAHEAAVTTARVLAPAVAVDPPVSPPSCTFVAAVVDGPLVVTGCVGDSRAYWVADGGDALQLTTDDSWAAEAMAQGVPREEAESGPHAHAITRWLGMDSPDAAPSLVQLTVTEPGWVVVCSDGLWNYCSEAGDLAALVTHLAATTGPDPAALANGLVAWANEQGGHDNISVALARLGEPGAAPPS